MIHHSSFNINVKIRNKNTKIDKQLLCQKEIRIMYHQSMSKHHKNQMKHILNFWVG